ncbi:2-oxo acid dehydrogenase subunit E2 [Sphaerisporangium rubeum]|uniref:Dihydrolipoamide acetyltransferase component of pyruvate dehydrogenase complex n=1 Tax=Sphaerisporangium rubeum TaxID=321317 RepID=A0A7X0M8D0_9ACTN|nr:2-oxo acid dehydrogenase subunit E2 [Sphaerisporangium rubeum]MBB6475713.1 pyruvate dehydrogenase E2 component (dihydrolipoamide acetyltransferase) [Sphaerisporangium rubeum]
MTEIYIPVLGMAPDEVLLVSWLKNPGDEVAAGEPVALVETAKAELEVESPEDGVLGPHLYPAASHIQPGATISHVLAPGESPPQETPAVPETAMSSGTAEAPAETEAPVVETPAVAVEAPAETATETVAEAVTEIPAEAGTRTSSAVNGDAGGRRPHELSPRRRRLAFEAAAAGPATAGTGPAAETGPAVAATAAAAHTPAAAATGAGSSAVQAPAATGTVRPPAGTAATGTVQPPAATTATDAGTPAPVAAKQDVPQDLDRHRAAIARSVSLSWQTIPHFTVTREIRMEPALDTLKGWKIVLPRLTLTDFLLRAFALALTERQGTTDVALGLAVATERGVVIPVLPSVPHQDLAALSTARWAAAERAQQGRMVASDGLTPAGTLSNLGSRGVDSFTGVVPYGQSALLTVGRAAQRPVVQDGALAVGTTMQATLNVDHRYWDGHHAAEVLERLAAILATPTLLTGSGIVQEGRQS